MEILKKKIVIFDNHSIPRKYRNAELFFGWIMKDKRFRYCSEGTKSKTGRQQIRVEDANGSGLFDIYLKETEYSLRP